MKRGCTEITDQSHVLALGVAVSIITNTFIGMMFGKRMKDFTFKINF